MDACEEPKRRKGRRRPRPAPGSSPGTLVVDPQAPAPKLHVIAYGADRIEEADLASSEDVARYLGRFAVLWLDVTGLGDAGTIERVGEAFGLHRLSISDVVHTHQRPKVESFEGYLYLVTRMLDLSRELDTEQISLFLGKGFVLTFQEQPGDAFGPVRERIRAKHGRIRTAGPDYLAYALLDAIVDGYYPVLEAFGERLEAIEGEILAGCRPDHVHAIREAKRELLLLRRTIWPQRDVFHQLVRETPDLIQEETRPYLNDVYDHLIGVLDVLESYRELAFGLMDVYLLVLSHRVNEIMRVLTVISTIFIPLTFIAGVYGMNFDNMPELHWRWGYFACLGVMAAIAAGLLIVFRRRGWLGAR